MSRDCCVAIPLSAMGLSAVCDCDIHYFWVSFMRTAMALATFAWSSLSLRQFKILMWWLKWRLNAILCEQRRIWQSAHLHRLTLAFVTVQNLLCCLKGQFVCYSHQQQILWWVCIFVQAVTGQCNQYQDLLCWQQRLLGVCTFAQARLSLLYSIEIPCAGWNGDFATFMWTANDVVSLHQHPQEFCATISALYQCVKKCSQCVVIKNPH